MPPRYTFGPHMAWTEPAPPPPKSDQVVTLDAVNPGGVVTVGSVAADPAVTNVPTAVHVVYADLDYTAGGPAKAAELVAGSFPKASVPFAAGPLQLTVPGVQPGNYVVQVILEFAE